MRPFQPDDKPPAFAGTQFRHLVPIVVQLGSPSPVPGQRQPGGNTGIGTLDGKLEATAVVHRLRQGRDHTDYFGILALQFDGQDIGQALAGEHAGPAETGQQHGRPDQVAAPADAGEQSHPRQQQQFRGQPIGQLRQPLAAQTAEREHEGGNAHVISILS